METINKALDSASHAIWGETHPQHQEQEPLSGVQGKGKVTDPYDAGNRDIQPGAPSTDVATAATPAEPQLSSNDPTGKNSRELSPAINEENIESQVGSNGHGNGFNGITSDPSMFPEQEPPFGNDPVSTDASALNSTLNDQDTRLGSNLMSSEPPGLNSRTNMGPGLGSVDQNPMMGMVGGIGGGSAVAAGSGSGAGLTESGASEQRAGGGGGGGADKVECPSPGSSGEEDYEPDATGSGNVSQEALRGPRSPPPRPEYDFEKEMDGKPAANNNTAAQEVKSSQNQSHHHSKAMTRMKEKLGRAAKAGNHIHKSG